jgi:predicted lipoprotein with Yx(FWY)xxD motif
MLATVKGASLYTAPATGCTGECLHIWPPLYVATGKIPTGVSGLGTVSITVGRYTHLQVTYNGNPLYKFKGDSGTSVNGNGVGGFMAATIG